MLVTGCGKVATDQSGPWIEYSHRLLLLSIFFQQLCKEKTKYKLTEAGNMFKISQVF